MKRPPPIQYLVTFASAAHCGSFAKASEELHVTPSAVSQQIKTLEENLGFNLFVRKQRSVELSERGIDFYNLAMKTIETYEKGFVEFMEKNEEDLLRITTIPYIANEILIPNLDNYISLFPGLKLAVKSSMMIEDLYDSKLDAAIRFGKPNWPGCKVRLIRQAEANIVASEGYLNSHNNLLETYTLDGHTILSDRSDQEWQRLREISKIPGEPERELCFDSYDSVLKAAEQGLGLAIALFPISNKELEDKRLRSVLPKHYPLEEGFYFVSSQDEIKKDYLENLFEWVHDLFQAL